MRVLPAALSAEYIEEDSRIVTKNEKNRIRRFDFVCITSSWKIMCFFLMKVENTLFRRSGKSDYSKDY
jgi:hypothetical protein